MTIKSRLLKLESVAAIKGKAAARIIFVTVDVGGLQYMYQGKAYSAEEWRAWCEANTTKQDTIFEVHCVEPARDENGFAYIPGRENSITNIRYPGGDQVTVGIDADKV